ncbi:MAG: flavodoxin [Bacteroidetes bacterium]|nr:flavodoxin [Bacteroidota bacterium]
MKKIGLFFGYTGGNTEDVAHIIAKNFDENDIDVLDLTKVSLLKLDEYKQYIFGVSTVGADSWKDASTKNHWDNLFMLLDKIDLKGKKAAIFGLGNQVLYPDHFCEDMGLLYEKLVERGVKIIGHWPGDKYEFTDSRAFVKNQFIGLPIDQDNYPEDTEELVKEWTDLLKTKFK